MRNILLIIIVVLLASPAFASDSSLETYYELGRRGSSSLVEEEDLSDEFYYSKYNVKFSQKVKKDFSYYMKYHYYNKDFDNLENLDNNFHYSAIGLESLIYSKDEFLIKMGPDFEFKEKLYVDSPASNYDQIKFDMPITFKKESDWTVMVLGGVNSYHYPNAPKDQLKLNSKLEVSKKFFDKVLDLSAFYKFQYVYRQKIADRFERTCGASLDLKIASPFIKGLGVGLEEGMDNTIIYEEREDSYDFKYLDWHLKTKHAFLEERVKSSVRYADLTRNYADFDHNSDGFLIENIWDANVFKAGAYALDAKVTYLHKQFRYPYVSSPFAFHNNNIFTEAVLAKKGDWKLTLASDVRFYDYPARRINDKIYYIEKVGIEKYLLKKSLVLGFDYRYTFKNFLHKLDITENLFRLRANYRF